MANVLSLQIAKQDAIEMPFEEHNSEFDVKDDILDFTILS